MMERSVGSGPTDEKCHPAVFGGVPGKHPVEEVEDFARLADPVGEDRESHLDPCRHEGGRDRAAASPPEAEKDFPILEFHHVAHVSPERSSRDVSRGQPPSPRLDHSFRDEGFPDGKCGIDPGEGFTGPRNPGIDLFQLTVFGEWRELELAAPDHHQRPGNPFDASHEPVAQKESGCRPEDQHEDHCGTKGGQDAACPPGEGFVRNGPEKDEPSHPVCGNRGHKEPPSRGEVDDGIHRMIAPDDLFAHG